MAGRRPKLTKAVYEAIVDAVRNGLGYEQACILIGIKGSTAREWLQRGRGEHSTRKPTDVLASFAVDIEKAEAEFEKLALQVIKEAAEPHEVVKKKVVRHPGVDGKPGKIEETVETRTQRNWQAMAWILERTRSKRYTKVWRQEESKDEAGPKIINLPDGGPGE